MAGKGKRIRKKEHTASSPPALQRPFYFRLVQQELDSLQRNLRDTFPSRSPTARYGPDEQRKEAPEPYDLLSPKRGKDEPRREWTGEGSGVGGEISDFIFCVSLNM